MSDQVTDDELNAITDEMSVEIDETQEQLDLEAEAEQQEEAPAEETPEEETKMVDIRALHEARDANRDLREQLSQRDARMDAIQQRLDALAQPQAQEEAEPEIEVPDFHEDPGEHINARFQKLEQMINKASESADGAMTQSQQLELQKQFESAIAADQGEFMQKHPDYIEALQFERQRQLDTMTDMGFSEEQAMQAIGQSEYQMAGVALTNKRSPAEVIYNQAVRSGYQPKATEEVETTEEDVDITEADSMGASGLARTPSAEELMEASEDEFDKMFQELGYGNKMT